MVQWLVRIVEGDGFNYFKNITYVSVHKCNKTERLQFFKPKKDKEEKFQKLTESNDIFCLN
jgi:hypothetical protein